VPAIVIAALIIWPLWKYRDRAATFTSGASLPAILDDPCLSRTAVATIAAGTADAATVESFVTAIGSACRNGLAFQGRGLDERATFVSVGFIGTGSSLREDFSIGWPLAYIWGVRFRAVTDSIAHQSQSAPGDKPFIWFPPWPELGGRWEGFGPFWRYSTKTGEWEWMADEFRFTETGVKPSPNAKWWNDPRRVVALKIDAFSLPIAALWLMWVLARFIVRGWRRAALVGTAAVAVAATFWLFPSIQQLQSRSWSHGPIGSNQVWEDLRSLELRTSDVLGMLDTDTGRRTLADRILAAAPTEEGPSPKYLIVSIGPTWQQDLTQQSFAQELSVFWLLSTTDAKYIPPEIEAMPRDGRFSLSVRYSQLTATFKRATTSTENVSVRIELGWLCWIGLALAIAWSFPPWVVWCVRDRRVKRRAARGLCPKCMYQIASENV